MLYAWEGKSLMREDSAQMVLPLSTCHGATEAAGSNRLVQTGLDAKRPVHTLWASTGRCSQHDRAFAALLHCHARRLLARWQAKFGTRGPSFSWL